MRQRDCPKGKLRAATVDPVGDCMSQSLEWKVIGTFPEVEA
jgi:hypothetical protein